MPTPTPPPSGPPTKREFVGTGMFWSLVFGGLVAVALVIFVIQNSEKVPVEFLGWDWRVSLAGIVLVSALAGVAIDEVAGVVYRRRRRRHLTDREELKRLKS